MFLSIPETLYKLTMVTYNLCKAVRSELELVSTIFAGFLLRQPCYGEQNKEVEA